MRRNALAAALVVVAGFSIAVSVPAEARIGRGGKSAATPRLFEPHETVTPSAGPNVKFRWGAEGIGGDTHLYDRFRLFRGNQAYADSMIYEEEVEPGKGWTEVVSEKVSQPGIYCWTVQRIGSRSKTRAAFSVFKVEGKS